MKKKYLVLFCVCFFLLLILWLFFFNAVKWFLKKINIDFLGSLFEFFNRIFKKLFVFSLGFPSLSLISQFFKFVFQNDGRFGNTGSEVDDLANFNNVHWYGDGPIYTGDVEIIGWYEKE